MAGSAAPVIHVSTMGNLANQMIQFMVARSLAASVPGHLLSNVRLPAWGIEHPYLAGDFPRTEVVTANRVERDRLAAALNDATLERVDIRTYGQRMENFLSRTAYADLFLAPSVAGGGAGELVMNIRQGDILDGHHPDYVLLPVDFYAELLAETGLAPVFMGQLEDSPYMAALRQRFPTARFVPSGGALHDFEFIRRSAHVVPSISTFAWLAAWLGDAESVFLPVCGLLHPRQNRAVDLLPWGDARYRYYLFPLHYSVPVAEAAAAHATIRGLWRYLPEPALRALLERPVPARPDREFCLRRFDEAFYRAAYPDVAAMVESGVFPHALHHYAHYGFAEGRRPFHLDDGWYCRRYPIAALEIAQGDFGDTLHHYAEIGLARGYRRTPSAGATTNPGRA